MGEHALQPQTVLPLDPTAFTVAPQRDVRRAVADVVWSHHGSCRHTVGTQGFV